MPQTVFCLYVKQFK